jgi:hypothetical protein
LGGKLQSFHQPLFTWLYPALHIETFGQADNSLNKTFCLAKDSIMVTSIGSSSGGLSKWADSVFSKLDTKKQGYIEKSDLQSALSGVDGSATQSTDIDDAFGALDGDGDGKVTRSELTDAMTKLSDQFNAQFDASRMNGGGGMRPDGPPPGPPPGPPLGGAGGAGGPGGTGSADSTTSSTSSSGSTGTTEPADTNGDGTVSAQEQAAYKTKQAGKPDSGQTAGAHHERDPMRDFAHALQLLKAYSDNSDTSSTGGISVDA